MNVLKICGVITWTSAVTSNAFADLLRDPDFLGPYLCVHRELSTSSTPIKLRTFVYGDVTNAYEECPVFNVDNPNNVRLTQAEINQVIWQGGDSEDVNNLIFSEYSHNRDDVPHKPSCRFGIIQ